MIYEALGGICSFVGITYNKTNIEGIDSLNKNDNN